MLTLLVVFSVVFAAFVVWNSVVLFISAQIVPGVRLQKFATALYASFVWMFWTCLLCVPIFSVAYLGLFGATIERTGIKLLGVGALLFFGWMYGLERAERAVDGFDIEGLLPKVGLVFNVVIVSILLPKAPLFFPFFSWL